MKVEDGQRLERTEKMVVGWMCGVTLKNSITFEKLKNRLCIESVSEIVNYTCWSCVIQNFQNALYFVPAMHNKL